VDDVFNRFQGSKFVVLHLRQATQGSISHANTHPFSYGDNLLCHNGMITANANEYTEQPDETDSYRLLKAIEHQDGDSTPEQLEAELANVVGTLSVFYYGMRCTISGTTRRSRSRTTSTRTRC
jgi:predicted glutamine amidotransferase